MVTPPSWRSRVTIEPQLTIDHSFPVGVKPARATRMGVGVAFTFPTIPPSARSVPKRISLKLGHALVCARTCPLYPGEFNWSGQHLLIFRGEEVRHGDVTDLGQPCFSGIMQAAQAMISAPVRRRDRRSSIGPPAVRVLR
jgi:hypothetical protein